MNDLLNKDECFEIIKSSTKAEDISIQKHELFPVEGVCPGFLGDYFRLQITFQNGQNEISTKKFFVKTLPIKNLEKRKNIEMFGVFQKEVLIYRNLVPELLKYSGDSKWCPTCCLVRDDLLVLEDLKVDGYQITPIRYEYNQSHIQEVLKSLAAFHSSSIAFETFELKPAGTTIGEKYKDMLFETTFFPDNWWYQAGRKGLKKLALSHTKFGIGSQYENFFKFEYDKKFEKFNQIIDEKAPSKVPKAWVHRDLWKNNLMFRFEKNSDGEDDLSKPLHCLFVDFQISRYLPITLDVLIAIFLCTRARHYNVHIDHYLKFYHKQLAKELSKHDLKIDEICSWNDYMESINDIMLLPRFMNPLFITFSHLPNEVMKKLSTNSSEEYNRVLNVNRNGLLEECVEKDEDYRNYLIEALEDLIEYMVNN